MRGHFYPKPPTYIGGRQPFAPRLGSPQSGPTPDNPPPRTWVTFGIILASCAATVPFDVRYASAAEVAALVPAVIASNPPPASTVNFNTIVSQWAAPWRALPTPVRIAPILPVVSSPPPINRVALAIIRAQLAQEPCVVMYACSVASLLSPVVTPDNPPAMSRANFNSILSQWFPPFRPLPSIVKIASLLPAAVTPDNPPVKSATNFNLILRQWTPIFRGLPSLVPLVSPAPSTPPVLSYTNRNLLLSRWVLPFAPLPRLKVTPFAASSTLHPTVLADLVPAAATEDVIDADLQTNAAHAVALNVDGTYLCSGSSAEWFVVRLFDDSTGAWHVQSGSGGFLVYVGGTIRIDDFRPVSPAAASDALEALGCSVSIVGQHSDTVAPGDVIGTVPPMWSLVPSGMTIQLLVSTGLIDVPDVYLEAEADAIDDLEAAGVSVAPVYENSADVDTGFVIRQSPLAHELVAPGTLVTITVSSGDPPPASGGVWRYIGLYLGIRI